MKQHRPRATSSLVTVLLPMALALQSCALYPLDPTAAEDLRAHRAIWQRQGLRDYRYTVSRSCECLPEMMGPARVEVRGGSTVSVTPAQSGGAVDRESFRGLESVDELFATIQEAIEGGAAEVRARYDPRWGHPVSVFVDYDATTADDERGVEVSDFEPLP